MAEPAEGVGSPSPSTQTTCLHCGVELGRFSSGVKGLCAACSARVLTGSSPAAPPNGKETPLAKQATLPRMTRSRDALAALIANGPSSEAPRMVGELLAADKHLSSYFALVPFVGALADPAKRSAHRERKIPAHMDLASAATSSSAASRPE